MIPYSRLDWLRLLVSPRGTFTRGVPLRVLAFGAIALLAYLVDRYLVPVRIPIGLHELSGAVIALILAFRTNTAYARFWEGRSLWGAIVNASRNLHRLGREQIWPGDPRDSVPFSTRIVLFAHASRRVLRHESVADEVRRLIPGDPDADWLLKSGHPALAAATMLSRAIRRAAEEKRLDALMAQRAEELVGELVDALGGCEKISRTPTPLAYVLLMHRVLVLFLATLPFSLFEEVGAFTPIITMMVAYPALLIEGVGQELDDPFAHDPNDLPLTRICTTIERNLLREEDPGQPPIQSGTGPIET